MRFIDTGSMEYCARPSYMFSTRSGEEGIEVPLSTYNCWSASAANNSDSSGLGRDSSV